MSWSVNVGERVEAGQELAVMETDKVTVSIESPATGIVKEIFVSNESTVQVGSVVAIIDDER